MNLRLTDSSGITAAIDYANDHPEVRYLVARAASAHGIEIPDTWTDPVLASFRGKWTDKAREGTTTQGVTAAVRKVGYKWNASLHPRGRNGRFIKKGSLVDLFDMKAGSARPVLRAEAVGVERDKSGQEMLTLEVSKPGSYQGKNYKAGDTIKVSPKNVELAAESKGKLRSGDVEGTPSGTNRQSAPEAPSAKPKKAPINESDVDELEDLSRQRDGVYYNEDDRWVFDDMRGMIEDDDSAGLRRTLLDGWVDNGPIDDNDAAFEKASEMLARVETPEETASRPPTPKPAVMPSIEDVDELEDLSRERDGVYYNEDDAWVFDDMRGMIEDDDVDGMRATLKDGWVDTGADDPAAEKAKQMLAQLEPEGQAAPESPEAPGAPSTKDKLADSDAEITRLKAEPASPERDKAIEREAAREDRLARKKKREREDAKYETPEAPADPTDRAKSVFKQLAEDNGVGNLLDDNGIDGYLDSLDRPTINGFSAENTGVDVLDQLLTQQLVENDFETAQEYRDWWLSIPEATRADLPETQEMVENDLDVRFGEELDKQPAKPEQSASGTKTVRVTKASWKKVRDSTDPAELNRWAEAVLEDWRQVAIEVAVQVVSNENTPPETIARFVTHPSPGVRRVIAENPATPPAVIDSMKDDIHPRILWTVASRTESPETMLHLLDKRSTRGPMLAESAENGLAINPRLSDHPEILERLRAQVEQNGGAGRLQRMNLPETNDAPDAPTTLSSDELTKSNEFSVLQDYVDSPDSYGLSQEQADAVDSAMFDILDAVRGIEQGALTQQEAAQAINEAKSQIPEPEFDYDGNYADDSGASLEDIKETIDRFAAKAISQTELDAEAQDFRKKEEENQDYLRRENARLTAEQVKRQMNQPAPSATNDDDISEGNEVADELASILDDGGWDEDVTQSIRDLMDVYTTALGGDDDGAKSLSGKTVADEIDSFVDSAYYDASESDQAKLDRLTELATKIRQSRGDKPAARKPDEIDTELDEIDTELNGKKTTTPTPPTPATAVDRKFATKLDRARIFLSSGDPDLFSQEERKAMAAVAKEIDGIKEPPLDAPEADVENYFLEVEGALDRALELWPVQNNSNLRTQVESLLKDVNETLAVYQQKPKKATPPEPGNERDLDEARVIAEGEIAQFNDKANPAATRVIHARSLANTAKALAAEGRTEAEITDIVGGTEADWTKKADALERMAGKGGAATSGTRPFPMRGPTGRPVVGKKANGLLDQAREVLRGQGVEVDSMSDLEIAQAVPEGGLKTKLGTVYRPGTMVPISDADRDRITARLGVLDGVDTNAARTERSRLRRQLRESGLGADGNPITPDDREAEKEDLRGRVGASSSASPGTPLEQFYSVKGELEAVNNQIKALGDSDPSALDELIARRALIQEKMRVAARGANIASGAIRTLPDGSTLQRRPAENDGIIRVHDPAKSVRADPTDAQLGRVDVGGFVEDLQRDNGSAASALIIEPDGTARFTPERQAIHDRIIASFLDGVLKPDRAPGEKPTMYVLGGGPASGKSTGMTAAGVPEGEKRTTVHVDPDAIKYALLAEGVNWDTETPEGVGYVHEESSYLAKRLTQAGLERGLDVTLDGTGDGNPDSQRKKILQAKATRNPEVPDGYQVVGSYMTVPVEGENGAIARDQRRSRTVGEYRVRITHSKVSAVFPGIEDSFDEVTIWDTNVPRNESPILVYQRKPGSEGSVLEPDLYQQFLDKANAPMPSNLIIPPGEPGYIAPGQPGYPAVTP